MGQDNSSASAAATLGGALEEYFNKGVKEVIEGFPVVGDILGEMGIGCVTCYEGTCKLREVVEYHYLPQAKKDELWSRIGNVLSGGEDTGAAAGADAAPAERVIKYSPPMKELVDEHTLIKRWLALIPAVLEKIDLSSEADRSFMSDGIDFIKGYADRFHHAKEEDVLFKYFDETQEIIQVMYENHTTGRNHVRNMVEAIEERDAAKLAEHLKGYRALLTEHIKKEDEILYPWMDNQLADTQIGTLYSQFKEVNSRYGDAAERYEKFVKGAESRFGA